MKSFVLSHPPPPPTLQQRVASDSVGNADATKLVDTFRHLHPNTDSAFTCWSTVLDCRKTNHGTRIDLVLCSCALVRHLTSAEVMSGVFGSDHCPVSAGFVLSLAPAPKPPSLCSDYFQEFSGRQKSLRCYFTALTGDKHKHKDKHSSSDPNPTTSFSSSATAALRDGDSGDGVRGDGDGEGVSVSASGAKGRSGGGGVGTSRGPPPRKMRKKAKASSQTSSMMAFVRPVPSNAAACAGSCSSSELEPTTSACEPLVTSSCDGHQQGLGEEDASLEELSQETTTSNQQSISQESSISLSQEATSLNGLSQDTDTTTTNQQGLATEHQQLTLSQETNSQQGLSQEWKALFGIKSGPTLPPPPLCGRHREPSVLRTVKKAGPNHGRQFYTCARPGGSSRDPQAKCNFFQWADKDKLKTKT